MQYPALVKKLVSVTVGCLLATAASLGVAGERSAELEEFLENHCFDCHGGEDAEGDLDLSGQAL